MIELHASLTVMIIAAALSQVDPRCTVWTKSLLLQRLANLGAARLPSIAPTNERCYPLSWGHGVSQAQLELSQGGYEQCMNFSIFPANSARCTIVWWTCLDDTAWHSVFHLLYVILSLSPQHFVSLVMNKVGIPSLSCWLQCAEHTNSSKKYPLHILSKVFHWKKNIILNSGNGKSWGPGATKRVVGFADSSWWGEFCLASGKTWQLMGRDESWCPEVQNKSPIVFLVMVPLGRACVVYVRCLVGKFAARTMALSYHPFRITFAHPRTCSSCPKY